MEIKTDTCENNILEELYSKVIQNKSDFVYCNYFEKANKDIKVISTENNIFNCVAGGILIKKKVFLEE